MYKGQQSNTPVHRFPYICVEMDKGCVRNQDVGSSFIQYECLQKIICSSAPLDGAQVEHEQFLSHLGICIHNIFGTKNCGLKTEHMLPNGIGTDTCDLLKMVQDT